MRLVANQLFFKILSGQDIQAWSTYLIFRKNLSLNIPTGYINIRKIIKTGSFFITHTLEKGEKGEKVEAVKWKFQFQQKTLRYVYQIFYLNIFENWYFLWTLSDLLTLSKLKKCCCCRWWKNSFSLNNTKIYPFLLRTHLKVSLSHRWIHFSKCWWLESA